MFDPTNPGAPDLPAPPAAGGGPDTVTRPPAPDPQAGYADSIAQWIRQYFGRDPHPGEVQSWLADPAPPIDQVENAIRTSQEAQQYAARQQAPHPGPTPPPGPATPPPPAPGPNVGGLIQPFGTAFTPPPASPYPEAPTFTPPSMGEAANDQGYQFTLDQGKRNLDSWLSAHGTFNDSSAAEALQNYGQNAAATQYQNVWGRNFAAYQSALGPWQTDTARIQHTNDQNWQDAFNSWLGQWNVFKDQRDSTFNHQYLTATA